jgi:hypothetical protein
MHIAIHQRGTQEMGSYLFHTFFKTTSLKTPILESCGRTTSRNHELHELKRLSLSEFTSSCKINQALSEKKIMTGSISPP